MWDKLKYIHLNPIRAGIVEKVQHYIYSSASNYFTGKGLVEVEFAENPIIAVTSKNEFWKYNNDDEWIICSKSGDFAQREKRIIKATNTASNSF